MPAMNRTQRLTRSARGAVVLAAALAPALGCATGAVASAMVPSQAATEGCDELEGMAGAIRLGAVTGGRETGSFDTPGVSDHNLAEALETTLSHLGLLAAGEEARYRLDVHLVELTQPARGYSMEVVAFLRYRLVASDGGELAFDDMISASCTLNTDHAWTGVARLRLASEGAVRNNIAAFLDGFCAQVNAGTLSGTPGGD
jgi:hypothetical protein